jgi:hypothetical protein
VIQVILDKLIRPSQRWNTYQNRITPGNHDKEKNPSRPPKLDGACHLKKAGRVAGVHVIILGSYTDFDPSSEQYRAKTPWLVVLT